MTGLPQMWEPHPAPLPDHIEIGVRVAGMKMEDARRTQAAAAWNSRAVRLACGIEQHSDKTIRSGAILSATARLAREQYAYARFLMGIDDYWLSLPDRTIKLRMEYLMQGLLDSRPGVATPAAAGHPAPTSAAPPVLG